MNKVQLIAYGLAALSAFGGLAALLKPDAILAGMRRFPRSKYPAWILTTVAFVWAALEINAMYLGAFDQYKPLLAFLTPALILLCIFFMDELLAPRALGGLLTLIAGPILDAIRFFPNPSAPTPWRFPITVVCYIWIAYGIWLICCPYRFRTTIEWWTRFDPRLRIAGTLKLLFGIALAIIATKYYAS